MADGTVGVRQAADADRLIDNEVVTNDAGETVYRQKVAAVGPVTDAELRATAVPVTGTVTVANPTTNPETGLAKEDTLVTVRDTVLRRTDPLPVGTNVIGKVQLDQAVSNFVSPSTSLHAQSGRFWLSGSGRLSLLAAGNIRGTLTNPAGNTKTLTVLKLTAFATQGPGWVEIFINPTTGLPATAVRPRMNAAIHVPGAGGTGEVRADINNTVPLGGGTATGIILGVPGGDRVEIDLPPFVITPGNVLGLNLPFAGAADASFNVYWIEL